MFFQLSYKINYLFYNLFLIYCLLFYFETMDISIGIRDDWNRRRQIRLAQVRNQSKEIAKTIRNRVHESARIQLEQQETTRNQIEHKFKSLALNKLKSDFNYLIQNVGNGYSVASLQPDPNIVIAEKLLINRCKAISRGYEAEKRQNRIQEEKQMDKEMRERRAHFNKTVEKIRSTLITSIPNIDSNKNILQNISKRNKCFLIPSQVTLNESNIINWNCNKKISKPSSEVINSKENLISKCHLLSAVNDENKENDFKFKKLETDVKNYESLVEKLNTLSVEEENIRNKLFTWKEVPVPCNSNKHYINKENDKFKEITKINYNSDKNLKPNEIGKQKFGKMYESEEKKTSNSIYYEMPILTEQKNNSFENEINKQKTIQSNAKSQKISAKKSSRNINNMLQRINKSKQLLAKELSSGTTGTKVNPKKTCSIPNISLTPKRCTAGNDLFNEPPMVYAKLPDSFYNNQLETLKKQISKKKLMKNVDSKSNSLINVDLMRYINILLKMTPSDVDNLSTSSCSSVKLDESVLQQTNTTSQYYSEILNCISKCLNTDISDLSQDTVFDSPTNINLLNKLQELTNYYLDKTHEIKNICDESCQVLNDRINEQHIDEKSSENASADSSIDGEYILGNLYSLLQKKGLIKSDEDWPMFENMSDDDDSRSLTEQLLDINPHQSDPTCTCQSQYLQQYLGNTDNENTLQCSLENINEMLNWINKKKRVLFDEIYMNQAPINDIQSMNRISDKYRDSSKENHNSYVGLPDSFYNSTLKILEEYVKNKKQKKSKSNNNNTWINMELMKYISNLLKMSPNEIDNLSVSSISSIQLEQSILEISKTNLEYHKDILNYISKSLNSNLCDLNRDQTFSSPQYIGLLDKLYKLADYYTEKAQEMRNICLESPRMDINNLDTNAIEQISEIKSGDRKASCSLSSELSVDGAYVLDHLSTLLEQRGLIYPDGEWPIFGNDDEDDSRSLTDQLLDINPRIKSNDIQNNIKVENSDKGYSINNIEKHIQIPKY